MKNLKACQKQERERNSERERDVSKIKILKENISIEPKAEQSSCAHVAFAEPMAPLLFSFGVCLCFLFLIFCGAKQRSQTHVFMIFEQRVREKDIVMDREEKERASIYMDWGAFGLEERNQLAILIYAYGLGDSVLGRENGTWISFYPSVLGVLVKVVCFFN